MQFAFAILLPDPGTALLHWLSACSTASLRAIRQDSLTKYLAKDSGYGPDPRLSRGPVWPNTPLQIIATQETLKKIKSTNSYI